MYKQIINIILSFVYGVKLLSIFYIYFIKKKTDNGRVPTILIILMNRFLKRRDVEKIQHRHHPVRALAVRLAMKNGKNLEKKHPKIKRKEKKRITNQLWTFLLV